MKQIIIRISQVTEDFDSAEDIVWLTLSGPNPWNGVKKAFPCEAPDDTPNYCLIDLMEDEDTLADTVVVYPSDAYWFLRYFCDRPQEEWGRVRL